MATFEDWLIKARQDLKASTFLFKEDEDLWGLAAYHAQQCGEKSLKAYLAYKNQMINKTHNLVLLVDLCKGFDIGFEKLRKNAIILTPYSSKFRYPDDICEPTKEAVEDALVCASKIFNFIKAKIKG
jgi:HEPN domain-containing protein